ALLDDAEAMRLAEWAYYNVEEIWSAFNLLSEAVARGFRVNAPTQRAQASIDAWNAEVHAQDKVRMWVKNALIYGRCVMEIGPTFCKVRNPRFIELTQDGAGGLAAAAQVVGGVKHGIPVDRVRVFTLHRLFSDDLRGVSAVHPVLQTLDDMLEARGVNRAVARRYRAPIRLVELPPDATEAEQLALRDQLLSTPAGTDIILPPGARMTVLNHGNDAFEPDQLMREHLTDRIFLGLGVPKIALGLPDGSNRSVSEVQRAMLLADKVAPYQRQVKEFAEKLYGDLFGKRPTVVFEPLDVADEKVVAEVSKLLVESGIKTKEEVEEHYWKWTE
ncbi:MAG: phage portal protein, partial [Halobacteriales archaeon]|nr:phage portal protein [Halobacteriales archaeon]